MNLNLNTLAEKIRAAHAGYSFKMPMLTGKQMVELSALLA